MAFQMIVPPHKVKPGKLTISCNAMRSGPFKLMISIPHPIFTGCFGAAEKVDLHWGSGADEGKLLINAPEGGGHFKPPFLKHTVLIRMPPTEYTPDFKMAAFDPEHRQTPAGLVIDLPEWAWNKERQKAIRAARAQVSKERALGVGGR